MDESIDLFDDNYYPEDSSSGYDDYEPVEDDGVDSGGDTSLEDILKDILDGYFSSDEADQEADEETGQETDGDSETDSDTEQETETEENEEGVEGYLVDPEILSEINGALHQHADDVSGFMSRFTVSGNAVLVSLDDASSSLLVETLENQNEVIERMDHMSGLVVMVLFVLLFDQLHRFAKRSIKNLTRGDDNKNAADS